MPSVLVTGSARGIGRAARPAPRRGRAGTSSRASAARPTVRRSQRRPAPPPAESPPWSSTSPTRGRLAALDDALPQRLDAVVNNAGIVVSGPIEAVPPDELRRQLDVNVVGQVAVTQAVLPRLRASRGRVVFLSSLSGRVSTPMTGAYSASKFALEGVADALRMELRPWGVRVVLVEPAQTDTDVWREADGALEDAVGRDVARPPRALRRPHRRRPHEDDPALAADGLPRRRRRGDHRAGADGAPPEGALRRRRRPAGAGGASPRSRRPRPWTRC